MILHVFWFNIFFLQLHLCCLIFHNTASFDIILPVLFGLIRCVMLLCLCFLCVVLNVILQDLFGLICCVIQLCFCCFMCCVMQVDLFKIRGLISCTNLLLRSQRCISSIQTFGWIVIKDLHQQNCFSSAPGQNIILKSIKVGISETFLFDFELDFRYI